MRTGRQLGSEDSDFDWDALATRLPQSHLQPTVMARLAWIVLVLLVFGPPLGFGLATLLH